MWRVAIYISIPVKEGSVSRALGRVAVFGGWAAWKGLAGKSLSFSFSLSSPLSYDSSGASKDEIKERFAQTMEFVEEYLRDVVCQRFPFSDKEKNKLTFEVRHGEMVSEVLLTVVIFK